jgi:Outer membrane protein beta-barrel domain
VTKSFGTCGLVLLCVFTAAAQDVDHMETFLGYTYVRFGSAKNAPAFSSNGGGGQFAYNFNRWLAGVADLGAVHNGNMDSFHVDNTTTNFLFGPRLSFRFPRIRPYFQVLFGGVYFGASSAIEAAGFLPPLPVYPPGVGEVLPGESVTARITRSQTAFAMTAGGGLDIKINKHFDFRPIGLDFFLTRLQNLRAPGDNSQHNLRYTTGLNFTFGGPR